MTTILEEQKVKQSNGGLSRRDFLKLGSLFAGVAGTSPLWFLPSKVHAATYGMPIPTETDAGTKNIYTVCLMCHSACGQKVLVNSEGRIIKIDGNPYHPNCRDFPLDYNLGQEDMAEDNNGNLTKVKHIRGRCCPKAQSAIETVYNPHRVKHPLKRVGPRGSGKWQRITWEQAFTEIADRLKDLRDFSTPVVPGDTADDSTIFGTKVNSVVFSGGRNEHGQKEFTDRFWGKSFGTVNKRHDHTSICETSHHMAYKYMTNEIGASKGTTKMNADYRSAEYVIMFGFSAFEANFPMVPLARKTVNMRTGERGEGSVNDGTPGKYVVVDPRFSNTASKAHKWLPVNPGTDAALALAMGRHLLENDLIQRSFLKRPHTGAANTTNETCLSDATWLVNLETRDYLKPSEVDGLSDGTDKYGGTKVVIPEGGSSPVTADTVDAGELFFTGTVPRAGGGDPIPVKTVLQMYNDSTYNADPYSTTGMPVSGDAAHATAMQNWSDMCGVPTSDIETVAGEFGAKGLENRRCFAEFYRGPAQHTNGTYNGMAIISLNWLMGNVDFIGGGIVGGSHYHEDGSKPTNLYPKSELEDVPGKDPLSDKGIQITRIKKSLSAEAAALLGEDTSSPTKRPWFPFAQDHNYQEILPSIYDQYPYGCSALFFYWNDCAYSAPAHREIAKKTLTDESKVPLFVAIDVEFGETSVYADYLLPDSTYLERWSTPHVASTMPVKISGVRQPTVGWINGTPIHQMSAMPAKADYRPSLPDTRTLEDILIGIGKKLGLPGVGAGAFATGFNGDPTDTALDNAWDWHKRRIGNLAAEQGDAEVPGGGNASGGGADNTNLDAINYVLARGGRFNKVADASNVNDEYDPDGIHVAHKFAKLCQFYVPAFATTRNTVNPSELFSGIATFQPPRGAKGTQFGTDSEYPLKLITYKQPYHAMARTIVNPTLRSLEPENSIELSPEDAATRGISDGDRVKLFSRSNPGGVVGRARIRQIRPGVVAVGHSYGHWEMSSRPHSVDGVGTSSDPDRGSGVTSNPVMGTDPDLSNSVCYQDLIGGSASYYDTPVQVIKV